MCRQVVSSSIHLSMFKLGQIAGKMLHSQRLLTCSMKFAMQIQHRGGSRAILSTEPFQQYLLHTFGLNCNCYLYFWTIAPCIWSVPV